MGENVQIIALFLVSAIGSFLIGRFLSGKKGKWTFAAWLVLPFVLSFGFFAYMDTQGGEPWLIWLPVIWIFVAMAWIPVALIAALIGRSLRRRSVRNRPVAVPADA